MNTYEDFKHNNDMLHSLVNSRIQSEKVTRLISIRTQMSKDIIQSLINYADKDVHSQVYERIMDRVYQMKVELNQALIKDNKMIIRYLSLIELSKEYKLNDFNRMNINGGIVYNNSNDSIRIYKINDNLYKILDNQTKDNK